MGGFQGLSVEGNREISVKWYKRSIIRCISFGDLIYSGDYSYQYCVVYLKVAIRVELSCSHHNNNKMVTI